VRKFNFHLKIDQLTAIPTDAADRLIASRDGDAALIFLWLLRSGGSLDTAQVQKQFGFSEGRLESAIACILRTGCVSEILPEQTKPETQTVLPVSTEATYTPEEVRKGIKEDPVFKWLCTEAEQRLGRVLKQFDLETLYSIYDYLGMPADVIAMLIGYLAAARQDRIDRGLSAAAVSFHQISQEANTWLTLGIDTAEKADAHIRKLQYYNSAMGQVFHALGIRDRTPSPGEKNYIRAWLDAGAQVDLIAKAYDMTVLQKGSLNWPYMRSIIERWLSRGYHTVAEMEAGEAQNGTQQTAASPQTSFTSDYAERIRAHKERTKQG